MGDVAEFVRGNLSTAGVWFASAWSDEKLLLTAAFAHSTTKAILLLTLAIVLATTSVAFVSRTRRRVAAGARARSGAHRFSSALSGYAEYVSLRTAKLAADGSGSLGSVSLAERTARTGTRVETKVMNVLPYQEQSTIDLMSRFKWSLQSSQRVRWQDSHQERRGDKIYNVTESEDYVHLVFARELDDPNIDRIRRLEWEYFSIVIPNMPSYAGPIVVALLLGPLGWVLGVLWGINVSQRRKIAEVEIPKLKARLAAILEECDKL